MGKLWVCGHSWLTMCGLDLNGDACVGPACDWESPPKLGPALWILEPSKFKEGNAATIIQPHWNSAIFSDGGEISGIVRPIVYSVGGSSSWLWKCCRGQPRPEHWFCQRNCGSHSLCGVSVVGWESRLGQVFQPRCLFGDLESSLECGPAGSAKDHGRGGRTPPD